MVFEVDWGQASEASLAAAPVVGLLDPCDDRQAALVACGSALTIENVLSAATQGTIPWPRYRHTRQRDPSSLAARDGAVH